jgi:hypothetical protein
MLFARDAIAVTVMLNVGVVDVSVHREVRNRFRTALNDVRGSGTADAMRVHRIQSDATGERGS